MLGLDRFDNLPGLKRVAPRRSGQAAVLATLVAAAWPPALVTLFIWPPRNWASGVDTDWRLLLLAVGLLSVPLGLWLLNRSHRLTGRPSTRLGVIFRITAFGGLVAAALQTLTAVVLTVLAVIASQNLAQAIGAMETTLLIFGVAGLPLAILVGVSYALWAGFCLAFIAYRPAPQVKDRLGLMPTGEAAQITEL